METWIIVLLALVAIVVFIVVVDMFLKCQAKRKLRKARQENQMHISTAIATQQQQQQQTFQQPQSYGGVNLIKPDGDIYIVPREIAPIHAAPVDPKQYGYPVRYEDIVRNEKYAKQMPYNPAFQNHIPYQQNT